MSLQLDLAGHPPSSRPHRLTAGVGTTAERVSKTKFDTQLLLHVLQLQLLMLPEQCIIVKKGENVNKYRHFTALSCEISRSRLRPIGYAVPGRRPVMNTGQAEGAEDRKRRKAPKQGAATGGSPLRSDRGQVSGSSKREKTQELPRMTATAYLSQRTQRTA
jgi:hypothetical protein